MGEHVGEPDDRRLAVASSAWWRSITLAIDSRQPPAAGEHAADQRVVDAELAALALEALLRGAGVAVDLAG